MKQWNGRPAPENEDQDSLIRVWEIEPHAESDEYSHCVVRSYQEAVEVARQTVERLMDRMGESETEDEEEVVKIRLTTMKLKHYMELVS